MDIPWPPGGPAADISSQEGLAHCYVMQNTDINLYFPHAAQWTKNTLHVILLIIPFFFWCSVMEYISSL